MPILRTYAITFLTDFREALLIREGRWRENLFGGFATLNQPPRPRPLRRLRDIFLMGAATPPWPRRGIRSAPVSRVSHRQKPDRAQPSINVGPTLINSNLLAIFWPNDC